MGDVKRIWIEDVQPALDCGRYPVKREAGDVLEVRADILKEGHDVVEAAVLYRAADESDWHETPMRYVDNDRWCASVVLDRNIRYLYTVEAWTNVHRSWLNDTRKKVEAEQDVQSEVLEGIQLIREAHERSTGELRDLLFGTLQQLDGADEETTLRLLLSEELAGRMDRGADRSTGTRYDQVLEVVVDRVAARYGAWYEMFHRSQGRVPDRSATFDDCIARLPAVAAMGFDVVYLPPIHPIGFTNRKGKNNTLTAGPNDPGSPWAIGGPAGGHKAVHPDLGTIEDFDRFVAACRSHGIEVALDFALQCSPDHPYVREHPEWFSHRPDGTIKYAENPPKKYQDIFPLSFYNASQREMWEEMKSILLFWIGHGVKMFRVDNPHTKPFAFWQWTIGEVQRAHPDVIFLSEAFTRPKVMKALAKLGFTQSYTYFTWRSFKHEIVEYLTELTQSPVKEYLRGNFFTNTPDILPEILQRGGRPAFMSRLVLAGTLSSVYGIYNGYELCENTPTRPLGSEEYLNSEKYEYKVWDWDRPGNIVDYITRFNQIRRVNPALNEYDNLQFYPADSDRVLFYGKMTPGKDNVILVAVSLDPFEVRESFVHVPVDEIGIAADETYQVEELFSGARHLWTGARQWVRLDPQVNPAALFCIRRWPYKQYGTPCF